MNQQYAAASNKEECSIQHFLNLHRQFPTRRPQRGLPLPPSLPGRKKTLSEKLPEIHNFVALLLLHIVDFM